jgi:hypothetical protein
MEFNPYILLAIFSTMIIASFFFDRLSRKTSVPSVLLLIATGVALNLFVDYLGYNVPTSDGIMQMLGILGLLIIVFEAALELKLSREKLPIITKAFLSAISILIVTALSISAFFNFVFAMPFYTSLINAIPFSVISSAIAIPSVMHLSQSKREFITYESTFSDILGVMIFNFLVTNDTITASSFANFGVSLVIITIISVIYCILVIYFMSKTESQFKIVMVISSLVLLYSLGKIYHISTLLLVLIFGLFLNNLALFMKFDTIIKIDFAELDIELASLKKITVELSFFIRTF